MSLAAESVEVVPEQVWFFDKNGANFWAMVVASPDRCVHHDSATCSHGHCYHQKVAPITATATIATILIPQAH